jgi:hypothetical protein
VADTEHGRVAVSLFALGFALMLVAGAILVIGTLGHLNSIRLLWVSAGLSAGAITFALAGLMVPRR